ncbi:hypothetical protein [Pseudomonas donghuensis]|uniref:hypothetical protein n=1 Tax=Pseudomonas donghuensis TaxID=1163398 RepID=UPI0020C48A42|nr:hypothetical protein [Pseudomonas donghuensis]MBF4211096.1 hypothetical protein [Pseudomonas donghuensis]MCP6697398.1 hypothetical protein [Pseudomonas donghuensis]UVL22373.1 hypothetical protein LOY30_16040 [Pseudomonas donghuensis]
MKRIVGFALCLLTSSFVQAASNDINPEEARDFLKRLQETVQHGQVMAATGELDVQESRKQAMALYSLRDEGVRFALLVSPYAKCNNAAINAASSWQGLVFNNHQQYADNHKSYLAAAEECAQAAGYSHN